MIGHGKMEGPLLSRLEGALLVVIIGLATVLTLLVAFNREFQVDEVEHVHTAYNLRDGRMVYRDFVQVHPPLLYLLLYPVVDPDDPVASFLRARVVSTAILLGTIALVVWSSGRLEGRRGAVLAAGLALLETTLVERGMEVRADGLLALLVMGAMALELGRSGVAPEKRFAPQALLLGLGLMATLKAVFPIALFGVLWFVTAVRERRLAPVLAPLLAGVLPFLVTLGILAATGSAAQFLRQSVLDAASAGTGSEVRATFGPTAYLLREGSRNVAFFAAWAVGLMWEILRFSRSRSGKGQREPGRGFLVWVAVGMFASLWANPFPWPYVQVSALPPMVVLAACGTLGGLRTLQSAGGWRGAVWRWAPVFVLVLAALTAAPRLTAKTMPAMQAQFETLREIGRVSAPDDRFFDLAGLYFRPDAYPVFSMSGDLFRWYTLGRFPRIPEALRSNEAVGIVLNYRVGWLRPAERGFVADRFVHYAGNIFLLGRDLRRLPLERESEFEVLKTKRFRVEGTALLRVDGEHFREGVLQRGIHRLLLERLEGPGRLILDTPAPVPEAKVPIELFVHFD